MNRIIDQSFGINIRVMMFMGLYIPEKPTMATLVRKYVFYFLYVSVTGLTLLKILLQENTNIMQMNFSVIYLSATTSFCFKLLPFLTNGQRIAGCTQYFGRPRFAPELPEEEKIIADCIKECRRNSIFYFCGIEVTLFLWLLAVWLKGELPVDVWLPYDHKSGPVVYYTTFICVAMVFYYNGGLAFIDPLLGGLTHHATSQLKILKFRLQHLDRFQDDVYGTLRRCVYHHNDILDFISEFEACFSFSILCQFAGSLFTMCFGLIGVILAFGSAADAAKSLCSSLAVMFQIFFYCYYGTLLFEENNKFIEAVCMGPWYKYDVKIRKVLVLMMERSKIPIIVTAGKVVSVTLHTFVSVVKTSYSLIAVLNNY